MSDIYNQGNRKRVSPATAEIVEMAARGEDFTSLYMRRCIRIKPIRRIAFHATAALQRSLDERAAEFCLSREAVINLLLRDALGQRMEPKRKRSGQKARLQLE